VFNENESIEMPFRGCNFCLLLEIWLIGHATLGYVADERGEPILPPGMKEHLSSDLDRTIEDF
jgi:hypothetical protein